MIWIFSLNSKKRDFNQIWDILQNEMFITIQTLLGKLTPLSMYITDQAERPYITKIWWSTLIANLRPKFHRRGYHHWPNEYQRMEFKNCLNDEKWKINFDPSTSPWHKSSIVLARPSLLVLCPPLCILYTRKTGKK